MNTNERKHEVCARSQRLLHTQIYVPGKDSYLSGFISKPDRLSKYSGYEAEPVVSLEGLYDLSSDAWVTVNCYNALVLNTHDMLIADVDFGDQRLNRFAAAKNWLEVVDNLRQLQLLDDDNLLLEDWRFAAQSYRVYRTHSGCRIICTSKTFPWEEDGWVATRFMQFVRADPQYGQLCETQKCYRARLTPKPWRNSAEETHVCDLVATVGEGEVAEGLAEQVRLHDELTLSQAEWSCLA